MLWHSTAGRKARKPPSLWTQNNNNNNNSLGPSEEERKTFLHGVGEAISGFLEPFGVKVDVDVTGSEKPKETETTTGDTPSAPSVRGILLQ